jgi:NAD(P)-dependent dehydrogenase (short-subunit alcohol dehydrogenase family)
MTSTPDAATANGRCLHGKTALVTGAGRGFGRAVAEAFVEQGASVVLHYRSSGDACARIEARAAELGVEAASVQADLADPDAGETLRAAAESTFGRLDLLVNNAGVMTVGPFAESTEADWMRDISVNILGQLRVTRAIVPMMIAEGSGRIINMSSQLAFGGWNRGSVYSATKAFILNWTKSLAKELGPHGINVNAIGPGSIVTDMNREIYPDEQAMSRRAAELPLRRLGSPEDVAACAVFLASPASAFLTGQMLGPNGGNVM